MWLAFLIVVSLLQAEAARAGSDCAWITDGAKRLECYDKASAGTGGGAATSASASDAKPMTAGSDAKSESPDAAARSFRVVDAADIEIGTAKYLGKDIEVRNLKCVYADVGDYRCTAAGAGMLSIFTKAIEPKSMREYIESKCDQVKKALLSSACVFAARLNYTETKRDVVSGFQERMILLPDSIRLGRLRRR